MTQDEWLLLGIDSGFCSQPACITHDSVEMTKEEQDEFEDGYDPCIHAVRLWVLE